MPRGKAAVLGCHHIMQSAEMHVCLRGPHHCRCSPTNEFHIISLCSWEAVHKHSPGVVKMLAMAAGSSTSTWPGRSETMLVPIVHCVNVNDGCGRSPEPAEMRALAAASSTSIMGRLAVRCSGVTPFSSRAHSCIKHWKYQAPQHDETIHHLPAGRQVQWHRAALMPCPQLQKADKDIRFQL